MVTRDARYDLTDFFKGTEGERDGEGATTTRTRRAGSARNFSAHESAWFFCAAEDGWWAVQAHVFSVYQSVANTQVI